MKVRLSLRYGYILVIDRIKDTHICMQIQGNTIHPIILFYDAINECETIDVEINEFKRQKCVASIFTTQNLYMVKDI